MNLLGVQFAIAWENKAANHDSVARLVARARPDAGDLVVLPEMFATGFSMNLPAIAEGDDRPTERFLAQLAREHRVYVLGGVAQVGPDGRGRNQAVAFGPDGDEVARYAKIHPFSFGKEGQFYTGGERTCVFRWHEATVAPFVCYDLRFPEVFRTAVRQGAEVYPVIANWPAARTAHWLALLQARAIENQAYVIGVNRCGADPHLAYSGRSVIFDPRGELLVDAGGEEQVIRAAIDLPALRAYRAEFPALADLRATYVAAPSPGGSGPG